MNSHREQPGRRLEQQRESRARNPRARRSDQNSEVGIGGETRMQSKSRPPNSALDGKTCGTADHKILNQSLRQNFVQAGNKS